MARGLMDSLRQSWGGSITEEEVLADPIVRLVSFNLTCVSFPCLLHLLHRADVSELTMFPSPIDAGNHNRRKLRRLCERVSGPGAPLACLIAATGT